MTVTNDLVYGFRHRHEIGSTCGINCNCSPLGYLTDQNSNRIPETPLYILGEATEEDWRQNVIDLGGTVPEGSKFFPFYYFVTTD